MNINEFVNNFSNHPVLFIGTGFSLRYLEDSYTWDGLLSFIAKELKGNDEFYLDLKSHNYHNGEFDFSGIATELEYEFNKDLMKYRDGQFKKINDEFYENMKKNINLSRFKIYIKQLLSSYRLKDEKYEEILELKKVRKNIGSVITTNYDTFIERIFKFDPLIGNEILLSNPYGSVYKVHGCVNHPEKIIITQDDYKSFDERYELIRAQLLSLFIHNPIIFLGYSVSDENIKKILKTIFTYVDPNTSEAEKIRKNFLLVEYEKGSNNTQVTDHDIDLNSSSTIRINKIKTDNFIEIYKSLAELILPVSAMDIRKVQNIVKEIYSGEGSIEVSITEDMDSLKNREKVLAIGSLKSIKYEFHTSSEMMENYFKIVEESNHQLLELIDKLKIQKNQYFPIYAFSQIQPQLKDINRLKDIQKNKLKNIFKNEVDFGEQHETINEVFNDPSIPQSRKTIAIALGMKNNRISNEDAKEYLITLGNKKSTDYRKLLCLYDYKKYKEPHEDIFN
ncbi:SIR2 family protein [Allobacillus sp. SKP2-8]|uniref:SIR2 family protein n=1 Tax=unclassified Allobacillus TaxID=2628859 RepID=UPI001182D9B7|nr:SIR2 family protein [Allobacillus sp. SKP2-8]TSJ65132.1 SIR2 family protein [Allobacillus sp. SKP2-8]